uniref:Phosphorylated adapter RNA export protein n=1 Tax=Caenorhabditis japonica TaxID=281687 RepID=A0A8R1IZR6_CAEJA
MSFRKRRHDSDGDSDDNSLLLNIRDDDDDGLRVEPAKKPKNIWSDMLMEEQLLEKGQKINLDRASRKQPSIARGPESYVMPQDEYQRKQSRKNQENDGKSDRPVLVVTPASDDLFGDAPDALAEDFGVKKNEAKVVPDKGNDGWWGTRNPHKKATIPGNSEREPRKPLPAKKTSQLMAEEFSLESMLAAEFDENASLDELGSQMAAAMGEKDPDTVKKIVNAIGRDVSIKLFNGTKEIEKNGGMKTADGSRRRTPGGVFITLFKTDAEISRETKNGIFGDMRNADKQRSKNKRKAHNFTKQLEDMKRTMNLATKAAGDVASEELGIGESPFNDDVADMI